MPGEHADGLSAETPLRPAAIDPGTNVLVAGPELTGKREVLFDLVAAARDPASMLVTTKHPPETLRAQFRERHGDSWETQFVDCISRQRSMVAVRDTDEVRHVSGPGDLTGIGILASGQLRQWYRADEPVRGALGLHPLSTLLMYANLRRVYQFMHVLTGRVHSAACIGAYALDTVASDPMPAE